MPAVSRPFLSFFAALTMAVCLLLVPAQAQDAPAGEIRRPVDLTVVPLDGAEAPLATDQAPAKAETPAPAEKAPAPAKPEPAKAEKKAADKKPAEKAQAAPAPAEKAAAPAAAKAEPAKTEPAKPEPAKAEKKAPAEKPQAPGVGQVKQVQMSVKDGIFVLRVITDKPVGDVQARFFKGPSRLAVDLVGAWRRHGDAVIRSADGPVKTVRVGEHPDRLRLVLDFRNEGGPEPAPEIAKTPDGVTVAFPVTP